MFFLTLIRALDLAKCDYAVAGGYAVALHGAVRGTVDIDLVINCRREDYEAAEKVLKGCGLVSKLPVDAKQVFDFRLEYIKNRNLIAWSFVNPKNPIEIVDILIIHDLEKMKKKRNSFFM